MKPITILVGENSSGKSSFLALVNVMLGENGFPFSTNFNSQPFELGSYDSIASIKGPQKGGKSKSFLIGYKVSNAKGIFKDWNIELEFREKNGQPTPIRLQVEADEFQLSIDVDANPNSLGTFTDKSTSKTWHLDTKNSERQNVTEPLISPTYLHRVYNQYYLRDLTSKKPHQKAPFDQVFKLMEMISIPSGLAPRAMALAAIRSKPQRTYDPLPILVHPEGKHVPYILSQSLEGNAELRSRIEEFGSSTGLFSNIAIKRHGKKASAPYMITVKRKSSAPTNLVDVGYGVSQALPIAVDLIRAKEKLILIQQPEVHLHPKAQAGLANFFASTAINRSKHLVIETHSDYLVDQFRILIKNGKIPSEDVSLLFFNKETSATEVSRIEIDSRGNLKDPPEAYTKFFLNHQLSMLD